MSALKKFDIVRAGQLDGGKHTLALLCRDSPDRDGIEWMLSRVDEVAYHAGRGAEHDYLPSLGGRRVKSGRERAWYVDAFAGEMRRELQRAYNEHENAPKTLLDERDAEGDR
jgi:hypothetical protein